MSLARPPAEAAPREPATAAHDADGAPAARPPRSLQGRLLRLLVAVVGGLWLGAALMTWLDMRHELDELLDGHLAQAAALLVVQQVAQIDEDIADGDAAVAANRGDIRGDGGSGDGAVHAPKLHRYAPRVAFQVFQAGRLVLRSTNAPSQPLRPLLDADGAPPAGFAELQIGNVGWRVFAAHGAKHDVQVFVGEQRRARDDIVLAALRGMLWPMLLALPLLLLAAWWAIRHALAPLRRLGGELRERRALVGQPLQAMEMPAAPAEIVPIVDALNRLFERIAELLDAERRFTADAAHELRTPIAAIRAQAQVALAESDDALRHHALRATLEGCDRATRLVEQLLTLARLEAEGTADDGAGGAAVLPAIDLAAIARRVCAELAPQALARGQQLELEADAPCPLPGEATLLAVLLRNLIDNALRYSPAGACVRVAVQPGPLLQVQDSGPGLPDADRARLGERFFRARRSDATPDAETQDAASGSGSGLGWSIVRRIAALHRLEVAVGRSGALGGLAVMLTAARPD